MDATLPLFDDYRVSLEAFEGPLDLLLHLIRKEEVSITDIPIERITAQYLAYLERWRALDVNLVGEFVVMAATLMLIKSRTLLPQEAQAGEEGEEEAPDPRLDLVRQLIEYKRCKDAAEALAAREALRGETFARGAEAEAAGRAAGELRLGDVGADTLLAAFQEVLARAGETVSFGHLKMQRWSVPEKMQGILARVAEASHCAFGTLFREGAPKGEIIVTFVALLELLRLRHVTVTQASIFGELWVDAIPAGTPDAHLPLPAFDELDRY